MKKSVAGTIVAVVAIGLIGGIVFSTTKEDNDKTASTVSDSHFSDMHNDDGHHDKAKVNKDAVVETNMVEISDFSYGPKNIKVKVGTTVTWKNADSAKHDITPDTASADFQASNLLGTGDTYTYTFTKAGVYPYHCSPHPYMKASVEVIE